MYKVTNSPEERQNEASRPAPGWYIDPENHTIFRYWDGAKWTEYRKHAPLPVPEESTPNYYLTPGVQGVTKAKENRKRSKFLNVVGRVAWVGVWLIGATVAAAVKSGSWRETTVTIVSYGSTNPDYVEELEPSAVRESQEYAEELETYIAHIYNWWAENMPKVNGEQFGTLEGGIIAAVPGGDVPACVSGEFPAGNAFYSSCADVIVYDDVGLFPELYNTYKDMGSAIPLGIVIAHEFGHAAQARTDYYTTMSSHMSEMQADCYAGAWLADLKADARDYDIDLGGSETVALHFILSKLSRWDTGFDDGTAEDSHGSGFDRVSAFTDGLSLGVKHCAGYSDNPPVPVMPQWASVEDYYSGGDLEGEDLYEVLIASAREYWPYLYGGQNLLSMPAVADAGELGCVKPQGTVIYGWCEKAGRIVTHNEGWGSSEDFYYGAASGLAWADAYKHVSGNTSHRACLVGVWVRRLEEGIVINVSLSPGDIDEALMVMVFADLAAAGDGNYDLQHVREFKNGYLSGCK